MIRFLGLLKIEDSYRVPKNQVNGYPISYGLKEFFPFFRVNKQKNGDHGTRHVEDIDSDLLVSFGLEQRGSLEK